MAIFDDIYCGLCEKILTEGVRVHNRTGIDTIKIPAFHFEVDLEKEFPILTTKKVWIRQAVTEMLWIYQEQSNKVKWLQDRNVHIWDKWEIAEDGNWYSETTGEVLKSFPKEFAGTIGTAYGYIVKKYNLINNLIDTIKNNPEDRRMVMSLWQDCELENAVLPSCVWSSEWDVTDGKINLWVHQRSCDVPLGLPFNVTQYAVLLEMIAQVTGYKAGKINWSIKDAHIYINQVDGIKEQLRRWKTNDPLPAPEFYLNKEIKDFYEFKAEDAKLVNYKEMGAIQFPLTQ